MGQRLNIEIHDKDGLVANAYYHWSGFTRTACELTTGLIDYIVGHPVNPSHDRRLTAIHILEQTGAGMTQSELMWLKNSDPKYFSLGFGHFPGASHFVVQCTSRNDGIISVQPVEMNRTRRWEEGRVVIHLDTKTVDFKVFTTYTEEEAMESLYDEYNLPKVTGSFEGIPFNEFSLFAEMLDSPGYEWGVQTESGAVIMWIE